MYGGDTTLANKLRRLLAFLAIGLVASVVAEFAISLIEAGRSWWSSGGTDTVILKVATALLAVACGLLVLGSLGLLACRPSARGALLAGSVIWLVAVVGLLSVQASYALRGPRTGTSWQVVIRQAENWTVMSSALPLLLFAFAGWPELFPQPRAATVGLPEQDAGAERSSLATRLMRVLSVYAIAFGGTSLVVLVYLVAAHGMSLPDLRVPVSFADACQQFGAILDWGSAALLVTGAVGELQSRTWGRRLMVVGAAAWVAGTLSSLIWGVLISGGSMSDQLPLYTLMLVGRLERSLFPVMLLVCLRWTEVRGAIASGGPGFQPVLTQSPEGIQAGSSERPT